MVFGSFVRSSMIQGSKFCYVRRVIAGIARNELIRKATLVRRPTVAAAVGGGIGGGGLLALGLWQKATEDPEVAYKKKIDEIAARADAMYNNRMFDGLYEYLKEHCSSPGYSAAGESAELLWRMARVTFERSKKSPQIDPETKRRYVYEAFDYVNRALELDDKSFAAHKWYAILLESKSAYEGTTAKIKESYKIKEHLQKALDLNPRDPTTWHILGVWYFTIANLKWYERKVASTFFAAPPSATFQEALDCFLKAEALSPNFYSQNLLYLGKAYKEIGDTKSAKRYFASTIEYVVVSADDFAAHAEAEKLLKEVK